MSRILQTFISVLFLLSAGAFASNTNDVMAKAASGFVSNFFSVFIPIIILGTIISIGLSTAQKKPELLGYGCGTIFLIGLALVVIDFIKAHSAFFTIAVAIFILIAVILFLFAQYEGKSFKSENKFQDNSNSLQSYRTPSIERTIDSKTSSFSQSEFQSEINSLRDPLHVYPATYEDVV